MLKIIKPRDISLFKTNPICPNSLEDAKKIIQDIQLNGEKSLLSHAIRLGDLPPNATSYIIPQEQLKYAFDSLNENERNVLIRTSKRIKDFASIQRNSIINIDFKIPGGIAGQIIDPISTAGCYAPGGRYPLPSSILMTAITAKVAGVTNIIAASPKPSLSTLAAAYIAGVDTFIAVGGAQAIACMAFGMGNVPACDIIVGPGNKWVTAAKYLVYGQCGIDMLAGPSECLIISDSTGRPDIIAADLIAQAEHDTAAIPILVTTSSLLIENVNKEIQKQLQVMKDIDNDQKGAQVRLSSQKTAYESIKNNGLAILCEDLNQCCMISDQIGPEHLEIMVANDEIEKKLMHQVKNYGGLFLGHASGEVLGDYGAGPNHVLPTGGTSKYTGGLSVHTFLKIRTYMKINDTKESDEMLCDSITLARMEGLEGHARAAEIRLP